MITYLRKCRGISYFVKVLMITYLRLNKKSGMFHKMEDNQIKEIIHAAKCSVFFINESKRVTLQDIGRVDEIRKWAEEEKIQITELELVSQFRCNGSDEYLAFLDNLLEIRETANIRLNNNDYDFEVIKTLYQQRVQHIGNIRLTVAH